MIDKILVVEDDKNLRLTLVDNLELDGYEVLCAATLNAAQQILATQPISLTVLDIMLPDGSGYDFAKELRVKQPNTMILMLTARTLNSDLITGFSAGADDYMTKPYKLNELLVRIKALLARSHLSSSHLAQQCCINGYRVNWQERRIINEKDNALDHVTHLTKKEFDLLHLLYQNIDKPLSRQEILNKVWGQGIYVENRTVDNFISVIRKALNLNAPEQYSIRTIRGIGYSLVKNPLN